ncbi:hypothetical protein, partial [Vescimonas sp.]|uniref:hypothetical protein n=1 Tax=Vescimonas sp. TaxID=2892404 RepID=UPI003077F559
AGKLDIALEMKDASGSWVSAEGKTMDFVKAADAENEAILWEPGCIYTLPELRVVNNGNLALKYMIKITGIKGDAKLNEAIEWTIGDVAMGAEQHLAAGESNTFTIKGHMKESAGNDYMDLTISGISITVYATQNTVESDSFNNQYDKNAAYKGTQEFTEGTHTLSNGVVALNPNDIAVKASGRDTNVTITGGYYDGGNGGNNICVYAMDGATVTIQGGTFTVGSDASGEGNSVVESNGGNIVIEGGFFYTNYNWRGFYYVLNQKNDNPGTITVKDGTFVNYDPSQGDDNLGGSFVADGYSVVSEKHGDDTWYTVVKGTGVIPGTQEDLNNAISDSTNKDITVVMPADQTLTLDNGIANEGAKARNITFVGDGTQTVDVITNATGAEGGRLNYQRGSTFTFENVTVQAGEGSFDGIVCDELVYRNCTIKGKLALYGKATFINCTFDNTMANQYSIWTWGGTDVTCEGCTFNTNGKAILLYGRATAEKPTDLVVNNCTFYDRKSGAAGKAAIEVGNDYNATYTLTVNHATVNGFAAGKNTGSHLCANKNSMDAAHLTVTIDGAKVQ